MPNTIGCIDCTHVPIRGPSNNEDAFVNRKGRHINVQAVVDSSLKFTNVVAKWPGSCHDAYIWENSQLLEDFRLGVMPDGWLLGDSGYPLQPWLLTPIMRPQSPVEERFNTSLTRTRVSVERAFGLLKSRFRCLDLTGGALCYSPERVCKIIISCCILHNTCLGRQRQQLDDIEVVQEHDDGVDEEAQRNNIYLRRGIDVRSSPIDTWFT